MLYSYAYSARTGYSGWNLDSKLSSHEYEWNKNKQVVVFSVDCSVHLASNIRDITGVYHFMDIVEIIFQRSNKG